MYAVHWWDLIRRANGWLRLQRQSATSNYPAALLQRPQRVQPAAAGPSAASFTIQTQSWIIHPFRSFVANWGAPTAQRKQKESQKQRRVCGNKKRRWAKVTRQRMRRLTGHYSIPFFCLCLLTPSWMFEEGSQKRKKASKTTLWLLCVRRTIAVELWKV